MSTELSQLPQKARQINEQHQLCEQHLQSGLVHALNAGKLLTEAKEALPHGRFLRWAKDNCQFSLRTAQLYMRAATRWPEIEANAQHVAPLSLRKALDLIAEHHPQPEMGDDLIPPEGYAAFAEIGTDNGSVQALIHRHVEGQHTFVTVAAPTDDPGLDSVNYTKRGFAKAHTRRILEQYLPDGVNVNDLTWELHESTPWSGYHRFYRPYSSYPEPQCDDPTGEVAALEKRIAKSAHDAAERLEALQQFGEREFHTRCGYDNVLAYASERHGMTVDDVNGMLGIGAA